MANTKQRKLYLDFLRIIAIIFVIYNHTSEKGYYLYAFDAPFLLKVIYIATGALIAVAVPIFFMISGALLIPKEESIIDVYKKRVLRMVIVLLLFSGLQYALLVINDNVELSVRYFITHITTESIVAPYWYLYAYLAYLICLPLLRKMATNMTNREFKYLFAAFLVVEGLLAAVLFIFNIGEMTAFFTIPFFNRVVVYPLLGYYMEHRMTKEQYTLKGALICIALMIAVLILIVVNTLHRNLPYEEFTTYDKGLFVTGFTMVLDAGVFYIVKLIFKDRTAPKALEFIITALGSTVFGVYLIEDIIRSKTVVVYDAMVPYIGKFLSSWVWCVFVFLVGAVIIYIIKLIPGVKKLL